MLQSNILIDSDSRARLSDFGLASILPDSQPSESTPSSGGTVRWMAPELLKSGTDITKASDMYAFGVVIFEVRACHDISIACFIHYRCQVFAGKIPFADWPPTTVAVRVLMGQRPDRPEHSDFTDRLWELTQRCWDADPLRRPGSAEMVSHLRRASIVQPVHGNSAEVTMESWGLGSLLRKVSRRLRSVPSVITDLVRFSATRYAVPRPVQEDFFSVEVGGSETSLHSMKFGELHDPIGVQTTPSGPCGLFRRTRRGTSSVRDWNDDHGNLTDKVLLIHRQTFLNLILVTPAGFPLDVCLGSETFNHEMNFHTCFPDVGCPFH